MLSCLKWYSKYLEYSQSTAYILNFEHGVFIVNFEHISHLFLVFLLLAFEKGHFNWEMIKTIPKKST